MADPFPLFLPSDARRLFQTESLLRRFAQAAHWSHTSKLLEVHGSLGGLALTKALNCTLTVAEPEQPMLDALKERARIAGISDRVTFLHKRFDELAFPAASFDGIFALGRVVGPLDVSAAKVRPWLVERGRLGLTWIVKVGLAPSQPSLDYWATRLGQPLAVPRDALISVEKVGFEPELLETMGELELDEYYRELELLNGKLPADHAGAKALREELTLHRAQNGKSGVTWAAVIVRRKEPGEKPPASRDAG